MFRLAVLWVVLVQLAACGGEDAVPVQSPPPASNPVAETPVPETPALPIDVPPVLMPATGDDGPWVLDASRGQALFLEKCQHCHGPNGSGGYGPALTNVATCPPCADFTHLWQRIDEYMPFRNPEACDAACSRDIAAWIMNGFSTVATCSVQFRYDEVSARSFAATIRILNHRGATVPVWRLGFTLPSGHTIDGVEHAAVTQVSDQVLLSPLPNSPPLLDGGLLEIAVRGGLSGNSQLPSDLRLEASPCFTAPPNL